MIHRVLKSAVSRIRISQDDIIRIPVVSSRHLEESRTTKRNAETAEFDPFDKHAVKAGGQTDAATETLAGHVQFVELDTETRLRLQAGNREADRRRITG